MWPKILKLSRSVAFVLILCAVAGVLLSSFLWYHYRETLPRSPQPMSGRVYSMDLRGVTVYATRAERNRLHMTVNISFVLMALGIVGAWVTDPGYRRKMGWRSLDDPPTRRSRQREGSG